MKGTRYTTEQIIRKQRETETHVVKEMNIGEAVGQIDISEWKALFDV